MFPFNSALVTGGAGFIGSHIVDFLIDNGCRVAVLDDFSAGSLGNLKGSSKSSQLSLFKGSITNEDILKKSLKDVEVVFHEAAIVSVQRSISEPQLVDRINVEGTRKLLRCSIDAGVTRVVFASSAAVYGNPSSLPITESTHASPISPYGQTKLDAEKDCLESARLTGLETVILRYFNAYGPRNVHGNYSGVINKFAEKLLKKENPVIYGDGNQTRDFVYVKDIVRANALAATGKKAIGKIFNVGSGNHIEIKRLALLESRILANETVPVTLEYRPPVPGDILHSYCDISLIRETLGYEAKFPLELGLTEYFQWMKANSLFKY